MFVGRDEAPYPYVPYITAAIALMDAEEGIDTVIVGEELGTRYSLYCGFCDLFNLPKVQHIHLGRLRGVGELDDVSKTRGTYKLRSYRERGFTPAAVREMLAYACLKNPHAPFAVENVRAQPKLIALTQLDPCAPRAPMHASAVGESAAEWNGAEAAR